MKRERISNEVEYLNGLQDALEQEHPEMVHGRHWWGQKLIEEATEIRNATVDEPTLKEWQDMKKEGADLLNALLRYYHSVGIMPSDIFDNAVAKHMEIRQRAQNGYYLKDMEPGVEYPADFLGEE